MPSLIKLVLTCLIVVSGLTQPTFSQISPIQQQQAKQELERRNIDEAELKKRLLERGIDVEKMDATELAAAQVQIEQVIAEMQLEASREATTARVPEDLATSPAKEQPEAAPAPAIPTPPVTAPPTDLPPSKIWGHNIFRNKSLQVYQPNDNVKAPPSYRLSSGDIIAISIFGASQEDLKLPIDPDGFINPPRMPRIQLKGLRLDEARKLARARFSRYYIFKEGQFSLNVDAARTITINIYGETETNGSFTLSAINTVFNALVAAGGPKNKGSVRSIKVISGDKERVIDLYEFLINPSQNTDLFLENNDIIFIPPSKKVVDIQGAVERVSSFEMLSNEGLNELLVFANGFTNAAITEGITITRRSGDEEMVIDAGFTAGSKVPVFELKNQDRVNVPTSAIVKRNSVNITGAVVVPGNYALQQGMRINDLISRGQLRPDSRTDVAFLRRLNVDSTTSIYPLDIGTAMEGDEVNDILLQRDDQLIIFSKADFAEQANFSISGAVKRPLEKYPFSTDGNITVADAILLGGGLQPNASNEAFLIRSNPANKNEQEYLRLNLASKDGMDVRLRPYDELIIYDNERFSDPFPVNIRGAVRLPGRYTYDPSLGLPELFTLAGGLKLQAARNRIDVFRLKFSENEKTQTISTPIEIDENFNIVEGDFTLRPFDVVVVRSVPEFELIQTVEIKGEVLFPGDYALDSDNLKLTDLIAKAGGLTAESFPPGATLRRQGKGLVVIKLDDAIANPGSLNNLKLKEGDIISIPKSQDLVAIQANATRASQVYADSILASGALDVAFIGNHSAKWYVNHYAGGFQKRADRGSLTVQYPSGELGRTKKFLWIKTYPKVTAGSTIRINNKAPKPPKQRRAEPVDWAGVTQVVLGGMTTALTIYLLIDRANQ